MSDQLSDSVCERTYIFDDRFGELFRVGAFVDLERPRAGGDLLHPNKMFIKFAHEPSLAPVIHGDLRISGC